MGEFQILKNKFIILTIIIFSLLLTNISTYAQININQKNNGNNINLVDEDVPIWDVGYSWTYNGEIQNSKNLNFYLDMKEACLVVSKKENGNYNLKLGGDITGSIDFPDTPFSFKIQKVSGNIIITDSGLGLKEAEIVFSGMIDIELMKYKYPAEVSFKVVYSQTRDFISFPLYVGKSWLIPKCDISIDFKIKLFGISLPPNSFNNIVPDINGTCLSYDEVTSNGNTYNVYKIVYDDGSSNLSYAPNIGNMLMIDYGEEPVIELIATNYPSPENPQKPDKPTGPNKGKTNMEYIYTTKTIDPNQDNIKYGWDWDGDMIADEWTKYYNSNETISITHTFTQEGPFNIGVKARDIDGHESQWSDSLSINIPRIFNHSKLIDRSIIKEFINILKLIINN